MTQKWNVQYTTAIENLYQVCREDGSVVAKIKAVSGTGEDKATARLIAAAPAMLEALQAVNAETMMPMLDSVGKTPLSDDAAALVKEALLKAS